VFHFALKQKKNTSSDQHSKDPLLMKKKVENDKKVQLLDSCQKIK